MTAHLNHHCSNRRCARLGFMAACAVVAALWAGEASAGLIVPAAASLGAGESEARSSAFEEKRPANDGESDLALDAIPYGQFDGGATGASPAGQGGTASSACDSSAFELPALASSRRHVIEYSLYFPSPPPRSLRRPPRGA